MTRKSSLFLRAVFIGLLCGQSACSGFLRELNYVLLVGTGTNLRALRFDPTQRTLTEVTGSPVAIGGTVNWVTANPRSNFVYVVDGTVNRIRTYSANTKTLALTNTSNTSYIPGGNAGGMCLGSDGDLAYLFARIGGVTDQSDGATVNTTTGAVTIGGTIGTQSYRCRRRTGKAAQFFSADGAITLNSVNTNGIGTMLDTDGTGRAMADNETSTALVIADSAGNTVTSHLINGNDISASTASNLAVTGATEVERLGSVFYVSTAAQNTVRAYSMASNGTLTLLLANSVSGNPSAMSVDDGGTYLAVNSSTTGITTIYTGSTTGVLTAVASASTGSATHMSLTLLGLR